MSYLGKFRVNNQFTAMFKAPFGRFRSQNKQPGYFHGNQMVIPLLSSHRKRHNASKEHLLGGSVVLDKLAVLHGVAGAHPVDLLVHLSPEEERALVLILQ